MISDISGGGYNVHPSKKKPRKVKVKAHTRTITPRAPKPDVAGGGYTAKPPKAAAPRPSVLTRPIGDVLHPAVRAQRQVTRRAEQKAADRGMRPAIELPRRPKLTRYTPAQRQDIIRSTTLAIAKSPVPLKDLHDVRRTADKDTRTALNKYAGASTTALRRLGGVRVQGRVPTNRDFLSEPLDVAAPVLAHPRLFSKAERTAVVGRAGFEQKQKNDLQRMLAPGYAKSVYKQEASRFYSQPRLAPGSQAPGSSVGVQSSGAQILARAQKRLQVDLAQAGASPDQVLGAINALRTQNQSPALTVLKQFTRVNSAIAGGVRTGSLKGAARGFVKNDQSFSQVLKDAGAPKWLQGIGGLTLDIALDPVTYVTFGGAVPAKAAAHTAERVALAAGHSPQEAFALAKRVYDAKTAAERAAVHGEVKAAGDVAIEGGAITRAQAQQAAREVARKAGLTKQGVSAGFRFRGREVKTSGVSTSRAREQVRHVPLTEAATNLPGRAGERMTARNEARVVNRERSKLDILPAHRPAEVHPLEFERLRDAALQSRALRGRGERVAAQRTEQYRRFMQYGTTEPTSRQVIDHAVKRPGPVVAESEIPKIAHALEADDLTRLPQGPVRELARMLQDDFHQIAQAEIKSGARGSRAVIGSRPIPEVTSVTGNVRDAARTLRLARQEQKAAEHAVGVYKGRAQVLSRNVGGGGKAGGHGIQQAEERLAQAKAFVEEARQDLRTVAFQRSANKADVAARDARLLEPEGYYPRDPAAKVRDALSGGAAGLRGKGSPASRGTSEMARKDRRALENMEPERQAKYNLEDLQPVASRFNEAFHSVARARLFNKLDPLTTKVTAGHLDDLPLEAGAQNVFVREGHGALRPVFKSKHSVNEARAEIEKAVAAGKDVRFLDRRTYDEALKHANRGRGSAEASLAPGRAFDKAQGALKTVQTVVNPGYHVTNIIGDLWNARLGGATANDVRRAAQMLGSRREANALDRDIARGLTMDPAPALFKKGGRVEKYGDRELSDAQVVLLAREYGAIQLGFAGAELKALNQPLKAAKGPIEQIRRANEIREDLTRLASFRRALKRGETPEAAARHVNRHHFDYSDLSEFERRFARRVIPFYTFMSRNAVLQVRSLAKSPGRFASYEKFRNETARQAGLPTNWVEGLQEYQQRALPFVLPGRSVAGLPVGVAAKLPATDLNLIDPRQWPDEFAQRISVFARMPVEQYARYSFFFRDSIHKELVPAPSWALDPRVQAVLEKLPRRVLGKGPLITKIRDPETGKMIPGWSWRLDQIARTLPLMGAITSATTPARTQHAGSQAIGVENYALGPRQFLIDPAQAEISSTYQQINHLQRVLAVQKQQATSKPKPGGKWGGKIAETQKQIGALQQRIHALDTAAGRAEARGTPAPKGKRGRKRSRSKQYGGKTVNPYGGGRKNPYGGSSRGNQYGG